MMRYEIETLTPIQIGNGERYTDMDSILSNNYFYAIDTDAFYKRLQDIDKLQDYLDYVNEDKSISSYLSKVEGLSPENIKKYSIALTTQNKNDMRYLKRANITQFIKNALGEIYIPGSELKGAIRTAIIYNLLTDSRNYEFLQKKLSGLRAPVKILHHDVEQYFLRGVKDDPKFDVLKYLEISDSSSVPTTCLRIDHIMSYWTKGKHSYAELLSIGTKLSGTLNIIVREKALTKLGLEKKTDLLSRDSILRAIYTHTNDIIEHEIDFYTRNHGPYTNDFINEMQSLKKNNTEDSPVLRIGQGQGFLSTTISLIVKKRDPELYKKIRRGTRGGWLGQADFPKTRRFVVENNRPSHTLGWLKFTVI